MGKNGKAYVNQNYKWDAIVERLNNMIVYVIAENI